MAENGQKMEDLFHLAKSAELDYPVERIGQLVGGIATASVIAGAAKSTFAISTKLTIMIGSVVAVSTALVVWNGFQTTPQNNEPGTEKTLVTPVETSQFEDVPPDTFSLLPAKAVTIPIVDEDLDADERKSGEVIPIITDTAVIPKVFKLADSVKPDPIEEAAFPEPKLPPSTGNGANFPEPKPNHFPVSTVASASSGYTAVHLNLSGHIILKEGKDVAVKFIKGQALEPHIDIVISSDKLMIKPKKGHEKDYNRMSRKESLVLEVTLPGLSELKVNGSGDITAEGAIPSQSLTVMVNGSGDIRLDQVVPEKTLKVMVNGSGDIVLGGRGKTESGSISVNGSGDIKAEWIDINNLNVKVSGSGDAVVRSNGTIDLMVIGSGDIVFYGNGKGNTRVLGSGDITNRN